MRQKRLVWIIAVAALVVATVSLFALVPEQDPRWRRWLPREFAACPDGAVCGQHPPAGPAFSTDGDAESNAALAEIREVLMRRGCQVAVVERINEDGTRAPALQVERVHYFIAMPDGKR
jgi:hypothetical protein